MNKVKCKDCRHYDAIKSGQSKNPAHGWCAVKSIYPFKEELGGPVFPPNVKRVESPELPAKPCIVAGNSVVTTCLKVQPK